MLLHLIEIIHEMRISFPAVSPILAVDGRDRCLIRLAELAGLELDEVQLELMQDLSSYYIHTRYQDIVDKKCDSISKKEAQEILIETEECLKWLLSML